MSKKNNRGLRKRLPQLKRDIKDFLLSEEGKISKKSIAKIGISLAILSLVFKPQRADAFTHHNAHDNHSSYNHSHANHGQGHRNLIFAEGRGGHNSQIPYDASHANDSYPHANSHGNGAWCW